MAAAALSLGTPLRSITSHCVNLSLQRDGSVVFSWMPGSDGIRCNKNQGRTRSSARSCLNLNPKHGEGRAKRNSMLKGMYDKEDWRFQIESGESRWDGPVAKFLLQENVVHGVTIAIIEKAVTPFGPYYDRYRKLMQEGCPGVEDAYWELVIGDVREACDIFRPIYEHSRGQDGYVSVEVAPYLARDGVRTLEAAKWLHRRVNRSNVYIRIPSTKECLPAIRKAVSLEISVNCTLIFSLECYEAVAEAYLQGLESIDLRVDLSHISSVACFFVTSVDAQVRRKLEELGTEEALLYRGKAAGAIAALALDAYRQIFSGPRWEALEKRGARKQRLLWASTSNCNISDTLYMIPFSSSRRPVDMVDPPTREAFLKHDVKVVKTDAWRPRPHRHCDEYCRIYDNIQQLGVSWSDVAQYLQNEGINMFQNSFENALTALVKADLENLFSQ